MINRRFLDEMHEKFPNDNEKMQCMSLIGEEGSALFVWPILLPLGARLSMERQSCTPSFAGAGDAA
jgi:hypothetical protein